MTALESVEDAIRHSGTARPWRVDEATFHEMMSELDEQARHAGEAGPLCVVLADGRAYPLAHGVPVGVWREDDQAPLIVTCRVPVR